MELKTVKAESYSQSSYRAPPPPAEGDWLFVRLSNAGKGFVMISRPGLPSSPSHGKGVFTIPPGVMELGLSGVEAYLKLIGGPPVPTVTWITRTP